MTLPVIELREYTLHPGQRDVPSMEARANALAAFYGGPVWKQHRSAANATMIDSDNVLLLQPAWPGSAAALETAPTDRGSLLVASIHSFADRVALEEFAARFRDDAHGAHVLAALKTEPAVNTFPALPVREGEHVFVWLSRFTERTLFVEGTHGDPTRFFLEPTSGSRLRGS